jgi:LPXTG-site transpeptidase (sortase) family protein
MKFSGKDKFQPKLVLGVTLVVLGVVFMSGKIKPSVVQSSTFASEPVEVSGFTLSENEEAKSPQRVIIPDLDIDLSVKPARLIDGYWEVFPDSAGWGEGSGAPGQPGNQVIFAHAREGLFRPLKDARIGMKIYVLTESEWFLYEVSDIKEVLPNQAEVIKPTEDERLTLYTCSGFADTKRLIVTAKRG